MDPDSRAPVTLDGACHCRAVRFTVLLPEGLASARRCTCSLCRMRGAVAVTGSIARFHLLAGADHLATYRFNTGVAEHHFCRTCGIYTHHKRRSNPDQFGINVACLNGLSPFDFREIVVFDGERHPSDDPQHRSRVAGVLRYEPADG
ncbi:GFA family protein [Sphingomonas lutea]|uniref:GFA family protein n=1 Tax=Sphingomonas lutea TaxID=1045317 RepID=A0A7G9SL66_9SPHN|nr:GFA family protein [Sphingomonas lutea]